MGGFRSDIYSKCNKTFGTFNSKIQHKKLEFLRLIFVSQLVDRKLLLLSLPENDFAVHFSRTYFKTNQTFFVKRKNYWLLLPYAPCVTSVLKVIVKNKMTICSSLKINSSCNQTLKVRDKSIKVFLLKKSQFLTLNIFSTQTSCSREPFFDQFSFYG